MKTRTWLIILGLCAIIFGGLGWQAQYRANAVPNSWKTYSNPTMGIAFRYPPDWKISLNGEDPVTHGDIMKNGRIYTSIAGEIMPPDFGSNSPTYISFAHSPLANPSGKYFDNLSVSEQLGLLEQITDQPKRLKNQNGVVYLKTTGCNDYGDCSIDVTVPTGKYVVSFSISALDLQKVQDKVEVFDRLINSITLN